MNIFAIENNGQNSFGKVQMAEPNGAKVEKNMTTEVNSKIAHYIEPESTVLSGFCFDSLQEFKYE